LSVCDEIIKEINVIFHKAPLSLEKAIARPISKTLSMHGGLSGCMASNATPKPSKISKVKNWVYTKVNNI